MDYSDGMGIWLPGFYPNWGQLFTVFHYTDLVRMAILCIKPTGAV